jgi:hypothetical protein
VLSDRTAQGAAPAVPVVQVEREARALLADLAAMGEPLPAAPSIYGRPVPYAVPALPEPAGTDR